MMAHKEFNFHIYKTTFFGQCWEAKKTKAVVVLATCMERPECSPMP